MARKTNRRKQPPATGLVANLRREPLAPTREDWDFYWQHVEECADSPHGHANRDRAECERLLASVGKEPYQFAADVRRFVRRGRR